MKKLVWLTLGLVIAGFGVNKLISQPAEMSPLEVAASLNKFNFELDKQLTNHISSNAVSSPYSLSSLLTLGALGAAGDTKAQLIQVLHLRDLGGISATLDQINSSWLDKSESSLANALWGAKNLKYEESFLRTVRHSQYNHFYTVDFAKNPIIATETINHWVEKKTHNYIKNLIPQNVINKDTSLVLVNAIYFKGKWKAPFEKSLTKAEFFTDLGGKDRQIPMMHQTNKMAYSESDLIRMVLLPYDQGGVVMAVLLPNGSHNFVELKNALDDKTFSGLLDKVSYEDVILQLPKFKVESNWNSLKDTLINLGCGSAFSDKANFTNMVKGSLRFTDAIQKAVVEVDEEGTVATAATGMIATATIAVTPPPKPPIHFIVNQPFLFVIFDTHSNIILFMGQVTTT